MAFQPDKWADGEDGGTPITADELNRIEQAGKDAADAAGTSPAWSDVTGKPASFPPATHTHNIADVTGLEARLAAIEGRLDTIEGSAEA